MAQLVALALALVGCGSVDLVGPTPDHQAADPPADAAAPVTAATGGNTGAVATGGTPAPVATGGAGGTTGAGGMTAKTSADDKVTPAAPDAGAAKDDGAKNPKDAETKMPKS